MTTALDPEMDFPDLSSMLEQTLESEMYERDSSIDQPPYVDSSMEGSLCTKYLVAEQKAAASKEAEKSSEVSEENKFYEKFIKENKRDRLSSLKCTVCKTKISRSNARTHPVLDVLVCKSCREVYNDGQFTQSDGTDDYCRWCAEGGVQVCCDSCSNVFCKECLKRNLGSDSAEEIEQSGHWNCLACNPRPIWNLRAECRWFMTASEERADEESSSVEESQTSRKQTMDIVETAEEIGTKYLKNIQRIKRDLFSSSDTEVEDFCAAICRIVEKTEATMKQLRETLRGTRNVKTSTSSKETDSPVKDDSNSDEPRLILKVKNFREKSNEDGYYAEINNSPKPKISSEKQNKTLQCKSKAQNDEKESVNSEDGEEVSIAFSDKKSATAEPVKETAEDSMDEFFDMAQAAMERSENSPQSPLLPEPENEDISEETTSASKNLPKETNQKARQELLAISDSDSRPSLASSSPRIKKTRKRAEVTESLKLKSKSDGKKNESPKASGSKEAKDKKDEDSDSDAAIEKRIKRLENLNLSKSKTSDGSSVTSSTSKPKAKKEKQRRTAKLLLDDSDEESNPDKDGDIVTLDSNLVAEKLEADPKETAREELLAVSSCSSSDDERSADELKKVKKKSNTAKKEKVKILESDEDFETKDVKLDPEAAELLNLPIKDKHGNEKEGKKDKKEKKKDGDEKKKRVKRRIKSDSEPEANSDSDFESDRDEKKESSGDSSDSNQPKQKRRRRIKAASSSGSGSDSDVQVLNDSQRSGGGKGRKNIKKIIKDKNLKDETKEAVREEQERIKRIAERQNFYNESFKDDYMTNARIEKLVLDFDTKTKKELVSVDKRLVEKLKPHQAKGIKFMWDACFESLERLKEHPGSGCILAHCMGLGKTLQVVTLAHTVLSNPDCKVKNVLVVCPLSTVLNWVNEFKTWLVDDMEQDVYELANVKQNDMRMYHVRMWSQNGGVLVMGYEMYRNITNEKNKRIKAKYREIFQKGLVDPGPDMVVCDEGHLLKNEASALSKAMNRIATRRRIVLTGTPLQNSLSEYHCMIQFVKPNLLGTRKEFTNRFANPIKNGQCADSTEHDVRIMKRRAHVLHKKLEGCVQRFDYSVLTPFLPPKHEYVISVKLSELQINMYRHYLEKCARGGPNASMPAGRGKGSGLFADFQELGKVWTHPRAMQLAQIRREQRAACDSEDSMVDFIDDGSGSEGDEEVVCLDDSDGESNEEPEEENAGIAWKSRTRAGRGNQPPPEEDLNNVVTSNCWWSQFVTEEDMEKIEHSGKLILLRDILRKCELIGDKVLVFSQSLVSLDLIEEFLHLEDQNRLQEGYAKDDEDVPLGSWKLNVDYFRFDGSTSAELRKNWCNSFNSPKNTRSRLFLISTRAGGLGINMTAANRVVIFDASWNPSHDVQSIFRVYRFGQKKPCYIYRFLAQGTMEEKIYDRQVTKLSLSCRVVDEQQIERHFNASDLAELYRFDAESHTRRPTPMVPKDRLLAELMMNQKQWITTFHEHDSLLQNKAEEELNEEERKAAWEDYENENRGIFSNPLLEASGGPGSLENQMQMLAGRSVAGIPLTHLASMIRSNNPAITPAELMQRLQLTVEQLQNLSVQQYMAAASGLGINQQPLDVQRLLLQRQQAMEQAKSQFPGIAMQSLLQAASMGLNAAGPSGVMQAPARRGRPPIGPYQRTDMGYPPIRPNILSSTPRIAPSAKNPPANKPAK